MREYYNYILSGGQMLKQFADTAKNGCVKFVGDYIIF